MSSYDSSSFSAGQQSGARTAACVARFAALELVDGSHWWNRRRHRLMARALVACAEEMELAADEGDGSSLAQAPGPTRLRTIAGHGPLREATPLPAQRGSQAHG